MSFSPELLEIGVIEIDEYTGPNLAGHVAT